MASAMPENPVPVDDAVPVQVRSTNTAVKGSDVPLTQITIYAKQSRFDALNEAMTKIGITGMTVTNVLGCGVQHGRVSKYRGVEMDMNLIPKIQVDIVVAKVDPQTVIDAAKQALYTGHAGDGKIFVYNVSNAIRISSGAEGTAALENYYW
jgi:Amt family ammonium transporter